MSRTRREFLQAGSVAALGLSGVGRMAAEAAGAPDDTKGTSTTAAKPGNAQPGGTPVQVPKIKFGGVEISRMVLGVNPFFGGSHYNPTYSSLMAEWYTQEKVCEVIRYAQTFGINVCNYVAYQRFAEDWARFQSDGGNMHIIPQVRAKEDMEALVRNLKPLGLQRQGEEIDKAFKEGTLAAERDWCKRARDTGALVGIGTHKPEVIETVEEQGWDVDFYAGCVYHRTRSEAEWRQVLGGEMLEMPREIYLKSDPPRMYKVMRQTPKTCFAFKILAAGRVADADVPAAFRLALESIKPQDGIYVGFFPKRKDEIRENVQIMHDILAGA